MEHPNIINLQQFEGMPEQFWHLDISEFDGEDTYHYHIIRAIRQGNTYVADPERYEHELIRNPALNAEELVREVQITALLSFSCSALAIIPW